MEIWKIMIETIKLELSRLTLRWTGFNPRGWESQDETLSDESNSNVLADSITYNGSYDLSLLLHTLLTSASI